MADDPRKRSFAERLAEALQRPVIAYPHWIRVETIGCGLGIRCTDVKLHAYRYRLLPNGTYDRSEKEWLKQLDRREYSPNGSSISIGGLPEFVRKHK